ncbi:YcaO-like family protein [Cutibacterium sp.]|uniref:YcaO-like family protein n=1 Tax=Cutibacterium sp. TaxID=1912221 RepID=UPI0026DBB898|nr:YcaO-like family protein [Cutibacterium sp.]MDO4411676.1 YcaO-like family protein [Cutibacterium sp.]
MTASDSVERKGALAECGVNSSKKTRILEVTLPISCLSPTLTAGRLTYADIVSRRKTNFPRKDIYEILSQESYLTSLDKLTFYILQQFILHNEVCFPEKQDGASYSASEYDVLSQVFIHSDLIPFRLTGNRAIPLAPSDYTEAASQNPRHGIVKRLRRIENHPTLPSSLITVQSDVADLRSASCWANNTVCQGSSFNNLHNAELSALGEAYERYCVNIIDPYKVVIGSANSLKRNGLTPVNPSDFVLFTPEQIHNFGGRFEGFHNETVTTWTTGKTFKGEEKLVPVSMVFVNHRRLQKLGDYPLPHINAPAYAGISAGRTVTSACVNALQELMERHATMCWWHNPPHGVRLSVEKDSFIGNLVTEFENKGNVVSIVNIENRFHVPIYAATVLNVESGIVNTGFGCRLTNEAAILKALTEACTLQAGSFDLLNPSGELFMAIERGELWEGIAKPWRQDRRYLDYYLSDFSTMNDLMLQQQVYLDWRLLSRVRPWLFPQQTARGYFYPDCHFENLDDELNYYVKILDSMSLEPVMIDVTSPDVQTLQISVIRVIVPGLVPNFAVGDLHLGNHVIQNEPVLLGYQKEPTSLDKLNVYPLPHC